MLESADGIGRVVEACIDVAQGRKSSLVGGAEFGGAPVIFGCGLEFPAFAGGEGEIEVELGASWSGGQRGLIEGSGVGPVVDAGMEA